MGRWAWAAPHAPCSSPGTPGGSASPGPGWSSSTQGCPACSHLFGFPMLFPVWSGSPAGVKIHVQHPCTTGVSPWHFPASSRLSFCFIPVPRDNPPFLLAHFSKILALDLVVQGGSPNPGGWGLSCLESRAVPCPAGMCLFGADFSVSRLSQCLGG